MRSATPCRPASSTASIAAPVLITLTLTFGLDLILNNAMMVAFTADYRGDQRLRIRSDRSRSAGVPAGRPGRGDGARAAADGAALPAAARQPHRPRHRRRPHGPRRGGADGRRRQAHQRHHLRHRRADGGRRRRAAQHDLPDLAAQQPGYSSARPSWSACSAASAACPARWSAASCSASSRASARTGSGRSTRSRCRSR